jgi:acyl-CoA thioester hydrolase
MLAWEGTDEDPDKWFWFEGNFEAYEKNKIDRSGAEPPARTGSPTASSRVTDRFVYDVPVRWSDMDAYGHVNNARFLTLYEEARVAHVLRRRPAAGLDSFEEGIVISRHEIDYLRPVDYGDPVRIELWLEEIKASRLTVAYELFDGDNLASRARTGLRAVRPRRRRPRRVRDVEREFLSPWLG